MKMNPFLKSCSGLLTAALMGLCGCASSPPVGSSAAGSSSAGSSASVDAALPTGRNLFLFDFSQSRYRKWVLSEGPSDTTGLCRILDTLQGEGSALSGWLALPAPSQPFSPLRAVWGPSGNFFLLDRAGKRLVQYDSSAQFLSSFPLPREIRDRGLDRFQVFWTRDGMFSFLDLGEGIVRQYMELRTSGGQGDWRLRNTIRLPVGLESCVWEPFFRNPCCIRRDAPQPICFDGYFNPLASLPEVLPTAGVKGIRPVPEGSGDWLLILDGGPACGPNRRPACFSPDKGLLSTCPSETDAAPAP